LIFKIDLRLTQKYLEFLVITHSQIILLEINFLKAITFKNERILMQIHLFCYYTPLI
jgi:hypothetical protein